MATECIPQVTFDFYDNLKPVVARFDQAQASTDGGLVLLKALDDRFRLTEQLAGCLADRRDPDKIRHPIRDLLRQWIFGLACGYEDGDDAARLADDPLHKLAVGRDPVTGSALASQPTLSRFEHVASPRALYRMGCMLAATGIAYYRERLKGRAQRITIDLDPTDDSTHGQQEFTFFNGHYDTWCYLPLVATLTFNDCQGSSKFPQLWSSKIPHPVRLSLTLLRPAQVPL
ncbi:MAG: transposase [Nitrospira sp.]|nr:transposase [Nitrospira sp.]